VSSEDIDKGARWSTDIASELADSSYGILCVTKENLHAPWLTFEAGALSKTMDKSYVSPFLFDIKRSEVNGPILQFQSTVFEKDDVKKLLMSLNKAESDEQLTAERLTKQDRHISFLGLREIHQKHLIADLVFLINELKTTLRIFLYFSVGYGLEL